MKRNMYLILFISAVLLVFVRSKMSVNAQEITTVADGVYEYSFTTLYTTYDKNGEMTGSRSETRIFKCDKPYTLSTWRE